MILHLNRAGIVVTILTNAGGRVVSLRRQHGVNLLKSDSLYWDTSFPEPLSDCVNANIPPLNGHIVWLGPQCDWWQQQDLQPQLKSDTAQWPPDPYLIYGENQVLSISPTRVVMAGPASPISGVQLTKEVSITSSGKVRFTVNARNTRQEPVSWDLWLNTRLTGSAFCYIPIKTDGVRRIESNFVPGAQTMPWEIADNTFSFLPGPPTNGAELRHAKAYLDPSGSEFYAFTRQDMLTVQFESYSSKQIHATQTMVEIYNRQTKQDADSLLELEYHGPYRTLNPGESMSTAEEWEVRPYHGLARSAAHLKFIRSLVS